MHRRRGTASSHRRLNYSGEDLPQPGDPLYDEPQELEERRDIETVGQTTSEAAAENGRRNAAAPGVQEHGGIISGLRRWLFGGKRGSSDVSSSYRNRANMRSRSGGIPSDLELGSVQVSQAPSSAVDISTLSSEALDGALKDPDSRVLELWPAARWVAALAYHPKLLCLSAVLCSRRLVHSPTVHMTLNPNGNDRR